MSFITFKSDILNRSCLCILFCCFTFLSFAKGSATIVIDIENKFLIAPEACQYQWFQNGERIEGAQDRYLAPEEPGQYTVVLADESGSVSTPNISIAINAVGAIVKIILIGDSTVANAPANLYPNMGWGQVFQYYFNSANIQVMNFAKSGTSTTTFYSSYWPAAKNAIAAGDYVFMQFGHNDQKESIPTQYAAPFGKYQEYLTKYANEIKAKGAIPIFVTSVNRNIWMGTKLDSSSLGSYPDAVRQLGRKLKIPVVDLHDKSFDLYMSLGQNYLSNYVFNNYKVGEYPNYPNGNADKTHFNEMGAIEISRLVIQSIKELSATNSSLKALVPFLNPVSEVSVSANPKASSTMITRTASYPNGMTITLKTTPATNAKFINWRDGAGKSVSAKLIYPFTMADKPVSYTAIFNGAVLGMEEVENETPVAMFKCYPNPFIESVQLSGQGEFEFEIANQTGNIIVSGKGENLITAGNNLLPGMYIVKIQSGIQKQVFKVIKE